MNELLAVIVIVVIIIIFNNLNNKIRKLEKEISDLNAKITKPLVQTEIPKQEALQAETPLPTQSAYQEEAQQHKIREADPLPTQKDWLSPVFDFLKQNALTIIGIFTLVLGIGYFVKYAIDKNWIGETARAGIGFCTAAAIILTGHFLRKSYTAFASIITGGGIAVLYFTITIAFREYHLFPQNIAFAITILITVISILLSYYYKSEVLIIFSLIGGFSAPLMISTGESNYLFLFIYLSLLNVGMLTTAFLKNWKSVGWTAYVFTTLYLLYWTSEKPELLSIVFYMISYVIFYIFALHDYIRKNILSTWDILMLALINFTSITGLVYTFNELKYEPVIIFPLVFAIINTILLFREYGKKYFGIPFSVFAGISVSLITIAIALQFKTHLITSVWAIEATLLLFIWQRTGHTIFKTCFYILFPLVIIAQVITWSEYLYSRHLSIIVNPVFLTSLVTVVSAITNLYLLKNTRKETPSENNTFFEDLISVVSYGMIYTALLLEIIYHIHSMPWAAVVNVALLFSLYYIFILLVFRRKLNINVTFQNALMYLFLVLLIITISVSTSSVVTAVLSKELDSRFYLLHLLQWIPFIYLCFTVIPDSDFHKNKRSYWVLSLAFITAVSCELHHAYVLNTSQNLTQSFEVQKHFNILYLPIIWTILASVLIYTGLKKNSKEYNKIGFALIALMVLKLYTYDVWQMDNISRISAFIVLGIILLVSSFTFQRFKNLIRNMVEQKNKNEEETDV
ncbi:DUF2339 domain-containing protein [Chryseobacterium indologenes]|uniref:DUF2339 domain-containing protein n=1 Tax=Chryseobacterium indologenes TaxID=253 RepID=UPI001623FE4A|nr:DUF2339 domain-containing protein [Chryseobacterium indologenes]